MSEQNDVIALRPANAQRAQAATWLAKLDRGTLHKDERAALGKWLAEDPGNLDALQDTAAFWYGLNEPLSQIIGRLPAAMRPEASPKQFFGLAAQFKSMALAGVFALILGVLAINFAPPWPDSGTKYYATEIGKIQIVSLPDGSKIHLNTNTVIEQNFSKEERRIKLLSGEAIFDVAHDESRPFKVYTPDGVIRAVGTRFAVRIGQDGVQVTVTEGRVALETQAALALDVGELAPLPVLVSKGESAKIQRQEPRATRFASNTNAAEQFAWTQGRLVFRDEVLQYVLAEVSRYTQVQINVADEALRLEKITGILQIGDIHLMLEGIEGALGVQTVWVSDTQVQISKK